MKKIAFVLAVVAALVGCRSQSGQRAKGFEPKPGQELLIRSRVLENNTMTFVKMTYEEALLFRPLDTVWVNLETHKVDDTCRSAMKCVLFAH